MRVVSMVPSWTETLIAAGIDVVGRTRFCIHPLEKIKTIPVLGGTKDINLEKLVALNPDFIVLDREENTKQMAEDIAALDSKVAIVATHVKSVGDVVTDLRNLAAMFDNADLGLLASRWEAATAGLQIKKTADVVQLHELSLIEAKRFGVIEWVNKPEKRYQEIVYVIWKNPFMAITAETFIGSILELIGLRTSLSIKGGTKPYPEIELDQFEKQKTLFLFSSEPYPFHKKVSELKELGIAAAIVNGESYSWFGTRSLEFLENQLK